MLRELLHPDKANLQLRYSLAHAVLKPGLASQPHILNSSEVYYILDGEGTMHLVSCPRLESRSLTPWAIGHRHKAGASFKCVDYCLCSLILTP